MQENNLPLCSCGSETVVKYQCIQADCPNFEAQKFYCINCCVSFEKHAHKGEEIANVKYIADVEERWAALTVSYQKIFSESKERCKPIKHLL